GRLRHHRQRREGGPHRPEAREEEGLPSLGLPGRPHRDELRRDAREAPDARRREGHPRHAAEELAGSCPDQEAEGVRRRGAPARRAAAQALHPHPGRAVSAERLPRNIAMAKIEDTVSTEVLTSFSTETPADEAPRAPRAVLNVPGAAVGRRKEAVAQVRLVPGAGTFTVNGRTL